jgi:hypothetical protein
VLREEGLRNIMPGSGDVPEYSLSAPATIRSKVDLPLPLAPISAILSPFSITASALLKYQWPGIFW